MNSLKKKKKNTNGVEIQRYPEKKGNHNIQEYDSKAQHFCSFIAIKTP